LESRQFLPFCNILLLVRKLEYENIGALETRQRAWSSQCLLNSKMSAGKGRGRSAVKERGQQGKDKVRRKGKTLTGKERCWQKREEAGKKGKRLTEKGRGWQERIDVSRKGTRLVGMGLGWQDSREVGRKGKMLAKNARGWQGKEEVGKKGKRLAKKRQDGKKGKRLAKKEKCLQGREEVGREGNTLAGKERCWKEREEVGREGKNDCRKPMSLSFMATACILLSCTKTSAGREEALGSWQEGRKHGEAKKETKRMEVSGKGRGHQGRGKTTTGS